MPHQTLPIFQHILTSLLFNPIWENFNDLSMLASVGPTLNNDMGPRLFFLSGQHLPSFFLLGKGAFTHSRIAPRIIPDLNPWCSGAQHHGHRLFTEVHILTIL